MPSLRSGCLWSCCAEPLSLAVFCTQPKAQGYPDPVIGLLQKGVTRAAWGWAWQVGRALVPFPSNMPACG